MYQVHNVFKLRKNNPTIHTIHLSSVQDVQELLAGGTTWHRLLDGSLGLSLGSDELLTTESLGVRVESEENGLVLEGVLLLGEWPLGDSLAGWSDNRLDLVRVDETGDVGGGDLGGREFEARLVLVDRVEGSNGRLGPDDESTDVTTWCELKQVQGVDGAGLDTWDVLESTDDSFVLVVDDQRSTPLPVSPVPQLSLSSSEFSAVGNLGDVVNGGKRLEELDSSLGLGGGFDRRGNDEGYFLDLLDSVTSGEDQ